MRARLTVLTIAVAAALLVGWAARASDPKAGGLIAFSREGNIYIYDIGSSEERQLTHNGVSEGEAGTTHGCPTIIDENTVAFLSWEADANGMISSRTLNGADIAGGSEYTSADVAQDPVGLGWVPDDEKLYYLKITGNVAQDGDPFGAQLTLFCVEGEARATRTKVKTWYGGVSLTSCRIRQSSDGKYVSVPRFPTDVSDYYGLHRASDGKAVDVLKEEWLGADYVTGLDFAGDTVYANIASLGEDAPLIAGFYFVDVENKDPGLLVQLDDPRGLAVSAAQDFAVLGNMDGELKLIELNTRHVKDLCKGEDPDIYPR